MHLCGNNWTKKQSGSHAFSQQHLPLTLLEKELCANESLKWYTKAFLILSEEEQKEARYIWTYITSNTHSESYFIYGPCAFVYFTKWSKCCVWWENRHGRVFSSPFRPPPPFAVINMGKRKILNEAKHIMISDWDLSFPTKKRLL